MLSQPGAFVVYLVMELRSHKTSQVALVVKNLPANAGDMRLGFDPLVGKIPWRRKWQSTPVILAWRIPWTEEPGSYSPWDCEESDTTECLSIYRGEKSLLSAFSLTTANKY